MISRRISMSKGKGSIAHNNREYAAHNINHELTVNNLVYVSQPIGEAYEQLFGEAVSDFNSRARSDRQIKGSYFKSLFGCDAESQAAKNVLTGKNKQKSFYEELVQIGDKDNAGIGTLDGGTVASMLDEYMKGWQKRNPQFHVFNAVLHLDEKTPHLHINYIPVANSKRGLTKQNGMAKALSQMGYNSRSAQGFKDWRQSERDELTRLCESRGLKIAEPQESRGVSLLPDEYKAQKDVERSRIDENIKQAQNQAKALKRDTEALKGKKELLEQNVAKITADVRNNVVDSLKNEMDADREKVETMIAKAKPSKLSKDNVVLPASIFNALAKRAKAHSELKPKLERNDQRELDLNQRSNQLLKKEKALEEKDHQLEVSISNYVSFRAELDNLNNFLGNPLGKIEELELENESLRAENTKLQQLVSSLQERLVKAWNIIRNIAQAIGLLKYSENIYNQGNFTQLQGKLIDGIASYAGNLAKNEGFLEHAEEIETKVSLSKGLSSYVKPKSRSYER